MARKQCGKRRNCSLRAISRFPAMFSKDLSCRHVKTRERVKERRTISVRMPRTTKMFAQRPLWGPSKLLLRCRKPYRVSVVTKRGPRHLFRACSKSASSIGVLCNPTASSIPMPLRCCGDACD